METVPKNIQGLITNMTDTPWHKVLV